MNIDDSKLFDLFNFWPVNADYLDAVRLQLRFGGSPTVGTWINAPGGFFYDKDFETLLSSIKSRTFNTVVSGQANSEDMRDVISLQ